MLIYSILIILTIFFHFYYFKIPDGNKSRKRSFKFLKIIFTLVAAMRYGVGTDYLATYVPVFNWLKNGLYYNYEYLFLHLNKFIIRFNGNALILLSLCSIFTIPSFFKFIKKNLPEKYWFLGVFLFIGTTIYYATMNVVRQYIAIAILLYAFEFLKENKIFKYILLNIVAILFHYTSMINFVFLAIYLLYKNKKINYLLIGIYVFSLIFIIIDIRLFANLFAFVIPSKYLNYLNSQFFLVKNYSALLKIILPNLISIFMIFNKDKIKDSNNFNLIYCGMLLFSIISNIGFGVNIFIRLGWYFDYFYLLVIPMIINNCYINGKKKNGNLIIALSFVYCLFWNIYSIFIQNGHGVVPYMTFWTNM